MQNQSDLEAKTSIAWEGGEPKEVTVAYKTDHGLKYFSMLSHGSLNLHFSINCREFSLSYFPLRLSDFGRVLADAFGPGSKCQVYGDFRPLGDEAGGEEEPTFYVHVSQKNTSCN